MPAPSIDVIYTIDLVETVDTTLHVKYTLASEDPEYTKSYERYFRPEDLYQNVEDSTLPAMQIRRNFVILEQAVFEGFAAEVRRLAQQETVEGLLDDTPGSVSGLSLVTPRNLGLLQGLAGRYSAR